MRFIFFILFGLVLSACCPTQRAALNSVDTITVTRVDTVVRAFPLYMADTVIVTDSVLCTVTDSVFLQNDSVTTTVIYIRDTLTRWKVTTQVVPDIFLIERTDTIYRVLKTEVPKVSDKDYPWLLILMLFVFLMASSAGALKS